MQAIAQGAEDAAFKTYLIANTKTGLAKSADFPKAVAGKTFKFPTNDRKLESIALEDGKAGGAVLVAKFDGAERRIACGKETWTKGRAAWGRMPEQPAAAAGAWTAADTFAAKVCYTETPFVVTVRLKFTGDEVRVESETNVGFGPTKEAPLVGKAG